MCSVSVTARQLRSLNCPKEFVSLYKILLNSLSSTFGQQRAFQKIIAMHEEAINNNLPWACKINIKADSNLRYCERITKVVEEHDKTEIIDDTHIKAPYPGAYMIGQVDMNPITKVVRYLIKIGSASDIQNRMRIYRTHNPSFFIIDTIESYEPDTTELEMRTKLLPHCVSQIGDTEWYFISEEEYLHLCETGFKGL